MTRFLRVWIGGLAFMVVAVGVLLSMLAPGLLLERYAGLPKWGSAVITLLVVSLAWTWWTLTPWSLRVGAWLVRLQEREQ